MPGIAKALGSKEAVGKMRRAYNVAMTGAWYPRIAYDFTSDTDIEKIKFLGGAPFMKKREGGRQTTQPDLHELDIENVIYDVGTEFSRDDIRRDKTGQIRRFVSEMGTKSALLPEERLSLGVLAGNSNAYDGASLYSDRSTSRFGGRINNDRTLNVSDPAAPTAAEMEDAIMDMIETILEAKDENNTPVNQDAKNFLVMVRPRFLKGTAGALNNDYVSSGVSNTIMSLDGFKIGFVINPWFATSYNTVHAFRADGELKGCVWQEEVAPVFEALAEGSDHAVKNDGHAYFAKRIGAVAAGEPAVTARCVLT